MAKNPQTRDAQLLLNGLARSQPNCAAIGTGGGAAMSTLNQAIGSFGFTAASVQVRLQPDGRRPSPRTLDAVRNLGLMLCDHCGEAIVRDEAPHNSPRCGRKIPTRYLSAGSNGK